MTSTCDSGANYFILFFLLIAGHCYGDCIESERDALLQFKNGLSVPSNRLSDWVSDRSSDCCTWTGVVCHNVTTHVLELHLRTLSPNEYFGPNKDYNSEEYEEYHKKSALGGKVSDSLLELKHLSYLDLSYNDFGGFPIPKFIGSLQSLRYLNLSRAGFVGTIPPQLGNLSNLHYLNLKSYWYGLDVKNLDWVSSLSSLEFLDMSFVDLSGHSVNWLKMMNSLPCLFELHLSYCRISDFYPTRFPKLNVSSLFVIDLSGNDFEGPIPNVLENITSPFLGELDLSANYFNSSIPSWLYDLTRLQLLDLSANDFQGRISSAGIGNLTSLTALYMSRNYELEFDKGIPNSFRNLCSLRSLDLSIIKLNQEMNDILEILSSGCVSDGLQSLRLGPLSGYLSDGIIGQNFKNLKYLSLSSTHNLMTHGTISTSFKDLCNLKSLSLTSIKLNQEINDVLAIMSSGCVSNVLKSLELTSCQLSGHLTDDLSYFKNLTTFRVSDNSISGPIPLSLGELNSLKYLVLDNNKLEGEISHLHFANLTKLVGFSVSGNKNITLRVRSNWIPPLQLQGLSLGSCHIGSQFPEWLRHLLKRLIELDLSNSGISTPIPNWFWDSFPNYYHLNLSHNQIHGSIPNIPLSYGNYPVIDLSSNNFSGAVPYFSSHLSALDLSDNSFSGTIFNFLCYKTNEVKRMQLLNLERNFLDGEIPDCWSNWQELEALKLSNNKFSGSIPNSIGTLSSLQSLHFRNNNLSGEIPSSIQNCKKLLILDFSENNLVGNVLTWIGDGFADLIILSLHANKFNGYLPTELCHLVSLHILDLAGNSFSGTIPSCFNNIIGMATRNDSTGSFNAFLPRGVFMERILLAMKGKVMEYSSNLRYVRSLDLSNNNLSGEIPMEIADVTGLLSLNLSSNDLTGRIPNKIGEMKGLEAIDLSRNQLYGEIPQSMSTLTFLGTLDLSHNNLSGKIPLGTQLQSFDSSSFIGNQRLCGLPLTKNCTVMDKDEPNNIEENDDKGDEVDVWFYASIAFGFLFGFWSVVGSLFFIRRWRHFYFRSVHRIGEKIWWMCFHTFH